MMMHTAETWLNIMLNARNASEHIDDIPKDGGDVLRILMSKH